MNEYAKLPSKAFNVRYVSGSGVQTYEIDLGSFTNCLGNTFTVSGLLYKGVAPTGDYASLASISGPAVGTNKYTLTVNDGFLADETVVYSLKTYNAADSIN